MIQIITCTIPAELWSDKPRAPGSLDVIQDLIQELFATRRRLHKKVNEEVDVERFQETCELLEDAVLNQTSSSSNDRMSIATFNNNDDYFALLTRCWLECLATEDDADVSIDAVDVALGGSVIPPDEVLAHITALENIVESDALEERIAFLRDVVMANGAGVVECQVQHAGEETANLHLKNRASSVVKNRVDLDSADQRVDVEQVFRARVAAALNSRDSVNMNNQNHVAITRVLAEYITASSDHPPGEIRVSYADGSEAPPFPLRCLQAASNERQEIVIPFSLMSMRHLLLDEHVVRNWFRNREIDQNSTLARSDTYCYRHSVAEFQSLRATVQPDERFCLHLYHTGYEPAVVGVYRAAVEAIRDGGDWLRIVPHFFGKTGFFAGPSWPPLD